MFAIIFLLLISFCGYTHEGEKTIVDENGFEIIEAGPDKIQLQAINTKYIETVKPIFVRKCYACHAETKHYPWYFEVPGAKQLILHDIREAKKHMDMSHDFPFQGHGTPEDDLKALMDTIAEGTMPPMRYWIMNWNSRLTPQEKQIVFDWVKESQERLAK